MKLINFYDDLGFITLRQLMNADIDGHFELFDPSKHTSLEQRSLLSKQGLSVKAVQLAGIKSKTLGFLDCRVIAIDRYQYLHFAKCPQVKRDANATFTLFTHLDKDRINDVQLCDLCLDCWQTSQIGRRRQRQPHADAFHNIDSLIELLKLGRYK